MVHVAADQDGGLQLLDTILGRAGSDAVDEEGLAADAAGDAGLRTDGILQVGFDAVPEDLLLAFLVLVGVGVGGMVRVGGVHRAQGLLVSGLSDCDQSIWQVDGFSQAVGTCDGGRGGISRAGNGMVSNAEWDTQKVSIFLNGRQSKYPKGLASVTWCPDGHGGPKFLPGGQPLLLTVGSWLGKGRVWQRVFNSGI